MDLSAQLDRRSGIHDMALKSLLKYLLRILIVLTVYAINPAGEKLRSSLLTPNSMP